MILILIGAPGTGKGTQGKLLSAHFNIPNISTGDILRDAIEKNTALGLKAKTMMDQGMLIPDNVMIGIIEERLVREDCKNGFILDGFPRTINQAIALDKIFEKTQLTLDFVIGFELNNEEILKRLTSRRVCRVCGKDYNILTNPPPKNNRCEKCGGEIIQRSDDTEDTVKNRLEVYEEKTKPVKDYYQKKGKLKVFNAAGSVDDIQLQLVRFLRENKVTL